MRLMKPITLILIAVLLAACGGGAETRATPGALLAQLDFAANVVPYDARLDELGVKCESPSRETTADNVAGAVKFLEDSGRKEKALEIMDGMIGAIPSGSEMKVTCSDIATGLVTVMMGGSVDASPKP